MVKRRRSTRGTAMQRVKIEDESDGDATYTPLKSQAKKRPARITPSPPRQMSNTDTSSTSSNGATIPPVDFRRVKDEPISREPSPEASVPVNGKLVGGPLEKSKRDKLEAAYASDYIAYSYPRYSSFTSGRVASGEHRAKRCLDLNLPDEVSDGETEANMEYKIDGLLYLHKESALVLWQGYKYATWQAKSILGSEKKRGPALAEYKRREAIYNELTKFVFRGESPWSITQRYPSMQLIQTNDYGLYVKAPGIVYLAGLHKRERQINDFLDAHYGRDTDTTGLMVIFVDWSDFVKSSIPTFEVLTDSEMTDAAKALQQKIISSNKRVCTCTGTCTQGYNQKQCCSHKAESKIAYVNSTGKIGNIVPVRAADLIGDVETSSDCVDIYECGDGCACEAAKRDCNQRAVQYGSQMRLTVFRHIDKGWTVHAGGPIETGQFVIEYTGIMMTAAEAQNNSDKTYQIGFTVKIPSGRRKSKMEERTLVIDAKKKGSIARYISHSCSPNLFSYRVHFEIDGRPKRHLALYAGRNIENGEELTYNYWAGISDPAEFHKKTQEAGFTCKCDSVDCREKKYQAAMRHERLARQRENNKKAKREIKMEPI